MVNAFIGQSSDRLSQLSSSQLTDCLWGLTLLGVQLSPKWLTLLGVQLLPAVPELSPAELLQMAVALDAQHTGAGPAAAPPSPHLLRALAAGWEAGQERMGPAGAAAALLLLARHGCCPSARGLAAFQVGFGGARGLAGGAA
jgi:hypothetical protein